MGVQPLGEPERRPVAREIDMRDLPGRMDAGVGPPGAVRERPLAGHGEDRPFQRLLHRDAVRLPLPADERRAVIFEREFEARHQPDDNSRRRDNDGLL